MTPLRQRLMQDLRLRNYSPRTVETYVSRIAQFAKHFGRSPDQLGVEQIRQYQLYLVEQRRASWALFNQTVCALRFLYKVTLGRDWAIEQIPYGKRPSKLPTILSPDEVARVLQCVACRKHRLMLMTAYSAGLRLSELLALEVSDIDSRRMLLRVRQGKGRKHRLVPLSPRLLEELRRWWREARRAGCCFLERYRIGRCAPPHCSGR